MVRSGSGAIRRTSWRDANYDIPLVLVSSTGKDNDTRYLIPLMDKSAEQHELDTKVVIADRGYDSKNNNEFLHRRGIAPVIPTFAGLPKERPSSTASTRWTAYPPAWEARRWTTSAPTPRRAVTCTGAQRAAVNAREGSGATPPATTSTGRILSRTSGYSVGEYVVAVPSGSGRIGSAGASSGCSAAGTPSGG